MHTLVGEGWSNLSRYLLSSSRSSRHLHLAEIVGAHYFRSIKAELRFAVARIARCEECSIVGQNCRMMPAARDRDDAALVFHQPRQGLNLLVTVAKRSIATVAPCVKVAGVDNRVSGVQAG